APVFLNQRKRRTADLVARDAESLGEAAHERSLPRTEIAEQQHNRTGTKSGREITSERDSCFFGIGRNAFHSACSGLCVGRRGVRFSAGPLMPLDDFPSRGQLENR